MSGHKIFFTKNEMKTKRGREKRRSKGGEVERGYNNT